MLFGVDVLGIQTLFAGLDLVAIFLQQRQRLRQFFRVDVPGDLVELRFAKLAASSAPGARRPSPGAKRARDSGTGSARTGIRGMNAQPAESAPGIGILPSQASTSCSAVPGSACAPAQTPRSTCRCSDLCSIPGTVDMPRAHLPLSQLIVTVGAHEPAPGGRDSRLDNRSSPSSAA